MARPKKSKPNHATGMYEYKATIGKSFDGKAIRKSFYSSKSLEDAKEKARLYMINKAVSEQTGEQFVERAMTFGAWANKWLEIYKKPNVKEHTYKWTYETNVINYFIPYFGAAPLTSIRQLDIQQYFSAHRELSATTLRRQQQMLKSIFETAIDNDYCIKNPVKNIKLHSDKEAFVLKWYSQAQADKLRAQALKDGSKYAKAVFLMLSLGLRRGELLGLMWKDIDLTAQTVEIKRAVEPDTKGMPNDGDVKSVSSLRTIPFGHDERLMDFLRAECSAEHPSAFVINGKTKYGYTSIDGFNRGYQIYMTKTTEALGLPYMTPHELRHSYGTILREQGLDLYSISRLLGHADTAVTEKHYIGNDLDVLKARLQELNKAP